jgi:hypothetical protein
MTNTSPLHESGSTKQKGDLSLGRGMLIMVVMVTAWILLLVGFHLVTDKMIGR